MVVWISTLMQKSTSHLHSILKIWMDFQEFTNLIDRKHFEPQLISKNLSRCATFDGR